MFLKALRVDHVRSLRELELSFLQKNGEPRRWTLIIGENGLGKTTLLRSIALVMAGSEALPDLLVDPDCWITNNARTALIEAEVSTAEGESRRFRLEFKRGQNISEVIKGNHRNLRLLDEALRHTARNYLTVGYGVSRRPGAGTSMAIKKDEAKLRLRSRAVATLFMPDAELQSLETWAMDLEYRLGKKGLDTVRSALSGMLPDVEFRSIDRQRRRLMFDTPDGPVPMQQLSDGYQNVAAWSGDLLYRVTESYQNYRRPLSARGLLLVDELDLHLHPNWQRKLGGFLDAKLPNFQIVATTHSALTAQQAGVGELYFLRREAQARGPTLHAFRGDPQKLMSHQLLLSDAFGLSTLNSPQVQNKRDRYVVLRDRTSRSPSDRRELVSLTEELQDIPDWTRPTATEIQTLKALKAIGTHLAPMRAAKSPQVKAKGHAQSADARGTTAKRGRARS